MIDGRQPSRDIVRYVTHFPSHVKAVLLASITLCVGAYVVAHVGLVVVFLISAIGQLLGQLPIGIAVGLLIFLLGAPLVFTYAIERLYRDISETNFQTRVWTDKPWTFISGTLLGCAVYVPWLLLPMSSYGAPLETVYALFSFLDTTLATRIAALELPLIATPALIALALPLETRFIPSFLDPQYDHQHRSVRERVSNRLPSLSDSTDTEQTTHWEQSKHRTRNSTRSTNRTADEAHGHQQMHSTNHRDGGSQRSGRNQQQDQSLNTGGYKFDWQFGSSSSVTFADVGGFTSQKKELADKVLKPLVGNAEQYEKLDLTPSNVILYGPPGTGKSHLAKAAMGQTALPTLSVSGGNLLSRWVNASAEQIARLFEEAHELSREHGGAIIFIDEIDSVLPTRGGAHQHREDDKVVNEFLRYLELSTAEMYDDPSIPSTTNVVVIGATNHYKDLDDAATRSGRIDLKLKIGMPDRTQRRAVLSAQLSQRQYSVSDATIDRVAAATDGYSAADLGATVDDAAYSAAANGRDTITESDLRTALTD